MDGRALQDLQDRMKKEAKREMDERAVLQRDEAAATKEDDEFKVCCCRIRAVLATNALLFAPDRPSFGWSSCESSRLE